MKRFYSFYFGIQFIITFWEMLFKFIQNLILHKVKISIYNIFLYFVFLVWTHCCKHLGIIHYYIYYYWISRKYYAKREKCDFCVRKFQSNIINDDSNSMMRNVSTFTFFLGNYRRILVKLSLFSMNPNKNGTQK